MAVTNPQTLTTGTAAFNARDLDGLEDLLADDIVFRVPGTFGEGKAACVDFYRRWFADFPDAHMDVWRRYDVGDAVIEEGMFSGTHEGLAATGRPVGVDYVQVVHVRNGKLVTLSLVFDRLLVLEQLGVIPDEETEG